MSETALLWDRVATLPPGPELSCLLASLPWDQVPNAHLPAMTRARSRQRAHEDAELLLGLVHMARSVPLDDLEDLDGATIARTATSYPWASSEIAAALTLTPTAADRELGFAEHLIDHLPLVFTGLREGRIDRGRAWIFTEYLQPDDLTTDQITTLCAKYVPQAPDLTTRQLAGRLGRAVIAIDPALRRRTYRRSLRNPGIACYLDPHTGTATLAATGLAPHDAAAACARLDRLAEATRRAGCPGTLGQINSQLALGMLDGRFQGMTEAQILDAMRTIMNTTTGTDELVREGVEVRVSLPTLMGRDERPGEIAGLGPILADVARDTVTRQHRGGTWQFAIIDDSGHLLHGGALRCRPTRPGGRTRGGVVQIDVTLAELAELATDPGVWAEVLAEIARSWAKRASRPTRKKQGRFARGDVARNNHLRDQNCIGVGCTRPARRCDLDHTHDHAHGGDTVEENIGPACHRHHPDKDRGWTLIQPEPGHFVWRSPLGQTYRTRGEPLRHDLPDPQPADSDNDEEQPDTTRRVDLPILWLPPARRQRPPPARRPAEPGGPPPF